jgi:hypothetical protein
MATKDDFNIGQTVYFTSSYRSKGLIEGNVTKVGRKYVTVNNRDQFEIETLREKIEYGSAGVLYLSKQIYLDEQELDNNVRKLREVFSHWRASVTLDQTRRILEILSENDEQEN